MASSNPVMSIVWLLILLFISFWVAGLCAGIYIITYCIEACVPNLKDINEILLSGVHFPHMCAKKMLSGDGF